MSVLSKLWLSAASLFEPIQYFFNGNFWKVFVKKFGKFERKKILDLACGTGEINKFIKPAKYLGIDLNSSYLKYAKLRFENVKIKFQLGNIIEINLLEKFDTALLISAAHHMSDNELAQLIRSVKKNKIKSLIIVDALPKGILAQGLKWLDATLGGGKHFRSKDKLSILLSNSKCKIEDDGYFEARGSFYIYYFLKINF